MVYIQTNTYALLETDHNLKLIDKAQPRSRLSHLIRVVDNILIKWSTPTKRFHRHYIHLLVPSHLISSRMTIG